MITPINSNRNQVSFGNVILNRPFNEWNPRVRQAVAGSREIRYIVATDHLQGRDTYITYDENTHRKDDGTFDNEMIVSIKGAKRKYTKAGDGVFDDLTFKAIKSTSIKEGLFWNTAKIAGPKDLGEAVAQQIADYDADTSPIEIGKEFKELAGEIEVRSESNK